MSASVLRIGPFPDDNDCAKKLQTAILKHFEEPSRSIRISNKYFTANVILQDIETPQSSQHAEDGIVLVFDAVLSNPKFATSLSCSFDSLDPVHDRAVNKHNAGDLLRLCVGVGSRTEIQLSQEEYEEEYSRRVLWCLDRGYEYVETDLLDLKSGHDERDKEGFPRIIEAISGTVWSTAVMNKKKQIELKQTYQEEAAKLVKENKASGTRTESPVSPTDYSQTISDKDREEKARQALLGDMEENVIAEDGELSENRKAELEDERNLNALESSLHEAKRIRELSRSGQLSDEERRQRANDAATLIYEMMGKMGFDDDESNEDDADVKEAKIDA